LAPSGRAALAKVGPTLAERAANGRVAVFAHSSAAARIREGHDLPAHRDVADAVDPRDRAAVIGRAFQRDPIRTRQKVRDMSDQRVLGNQAKILGNQATIRRNQAKILGNQDGIKRSLAKVLGNQRKILANQKRILAK
jgi:hypothetical protein